jgi:hypothetical protein
LKKKNQFSKRKRKIKKNEDHNRHKNNVVI